MWNPKRVWVGPFTYTVSHKGIQGFHWCMKKSNRDFVGREYI